jgi:hypothetical protein
MTHDFNQQAHPLLPSLQIENSHVIRATPVWESLDLERNTNPKTFLKIGGAGAVGISSSTRII